MISLLVNFYCSKKHAHFGWYIGIKKTGLGKNGNLTWYPWGQKAIQFVARKPYATPHPLRQLQNRHGLTMVITDDGTVKGKPEIDVTESWTRVCESEPTLSSSLKIDCDLSEAFQASLNPSLLIKYINPCVNQSIEVALF